MTEHALAIDIGATKIAVGRVSRSGRLAHGRQLPTPATADADGLFEVIGHLVGSVALGNEIVCGIGSCGPMTQSGERVSPVNIPAWREFPVRDRLAQVTGLPTFLDGDAKALALAEGWVGATAGRASYLSMVVSTGVGGGIVLNDRLLEGRLGNAGHIGHIVVDPDGHPCTCGSIGCLESEASGTAIAQATGRPAMEADDIARADAGRMVGRAVSVVANLLDLDVAAVGGSVALGFGTPFFGAAQAELDRLTNLPYAVGAKIVPSALGADGPLIGAAAVGWRAWDAPSSASVRRAG